MLRERIPAGQRLLFWSAELDDLGTDKRGDVFVAGARHRNFLAELR
jgi:hypothetical protein